MPFDGAEALLPLLQARAPLALADFVGHLSRLVPGIRMEVEEPGHSGAWWIEVAAQGLMPAVEWREGHGFALYGPGPTLPEKPNARLLQPAEAAQRLSGLLRSWKGATEKARRTAA